ncbi:AAA family ATPase [Candidatus Woesearchaeota archaeon]|nr:AAA family ATPase [Candidatus Woesearchaeota archaeon]
MAIIIVTGSVCSGKTTYAKKFAKDKGYTYIDVNKIIENNKKAIGAKYNRKDKCYDVDTDKLNKLLIARIRQAKKDKESLVIDSHLSHYIPKRYVDKCIVTRCPDLKKLKIRLQKRNYPKQKIEDNLEAEIMETCLQDALAFGHKVKIIDTSKKINKK